MSSPWGIEYKKRIVKLSHKLSVDIYVYADGRMRVEWDPEHPGKLTKRELKRYVAARNEMVATLARENGVRILIVNMNEKFHVVGMQAIEPDGTVINLPNKMRATPQ